MLKHFRSGSKRIRTLWWILIVGTVVTFIGGFVFIFGSGIGDVGQAFRTPEVVGRVGGAPIRQEDLATALNAAQAAYQTQYGTTPQGRDAAILREQAWMNLLTERSLEDAARRHGIMVSDPEVVYAARFTPPPDITSNPAFQTNGRFDRAKWEAALQDPSINWSPLEDRLRVLLPAQRLEERVIAGLKISEPELKRLFANQYDRVRASVVVLPLDTAPIDSSRFSEAALRKYYEAHKGEFTGAAQVQVEVVQVPLTVGEEEDRTARIEAESIVQEARAGRDFATLARERSEGPYAESGGDLGQDMPLSRLPANLQAAIAPLPVGGITDPIRDANTYFVFKVLNRTEVGGEPAVRLAQIQKPIRPSSETMQKDAELVLKLRSDSGKQPLSEVAARRQLVSTNTGWFAQGQFVPALLQMPQAQQWALRAKKGEVSRAYGTETGWILLQVTDRREAGPRPFEDAKEDVRRALDLSLRQAKPLADAKRLVDAVRAGQSLEQAAAGMGLVVAGTDTFPRSNPDFRIGTAPRAVGLVFGLPVGQVGDPVASPSGVLVVRKDAEVPGSPQQYEMLKGQLSSALLSNRQQRYLRAWIDQTVKETKVEDLRQPLEETL